MDRSDPNAHHLDPDASPANSGAGPVSPDLVRQPEAPDYESAHDLARKYALDERDIQILAMKLTNPRMTNPEIAKRLRVHRSVVWERTSKGPLATVLRELQVEVLEQTRDMVVVEALDAIKTLGRLARGENRYGQVDDFIPYAVQRAAAKDILDVLRGAGLVQPKEDDDNEVWEAIITEVGVVSTKRLKGGVNELAEASAEV